MQHMPAHLSRQREGNTMTRRFTAPLCVVLAALALASCSDSAAGSGRAQATNTPPTQATAPPNISPTATTTSSPQPVTGTLLGGPVATFDTIYGPPDNTSSNTGTYYIVAHVTVGGVSNKYALNLTVRGDAGTGGKRAGLLHLEQLGGGKQWDSATGEALAKVFLPRDAAFQRDLQAPNVGTEHVYQSADLALSFPASNFSDSQTGKVAPPGTFYYSCG